MNSLTTHTVVTLGDISFYVGNKLEWSLPNECDTGGEIMPAVVFHVPSCLITKPDLTDKFAEFQEKDDVFQTSFTSNSLLIALPGDQQQPNPTLPESLVEYLAAKSSRLIFLDPVGRRLPNGPYFVRGKALHQAWRLYPDDNGAFTVSVMPSAHGGDCAFTPLLAGAYSGLVPVVGVPSRLYSTPSPEMPLGGLRFSVKDNYQLAGIRTTMGSRSYTKLYGAQTETSALVKKIVDLGGTIVGKTKMGAFAGSEVPPEKCIDYFPPWNPRGDGYQGPSGSSMGAGASIASYDWLDIALGTDSTGSIRMPAASYGLWSMRASWGAFPMSSIMPNVQSFDTIGILTRTPHHLERFLSMSNGSTTPKIPITPTNVLYPLDWFPMKNPGQQRMVDSFVAALVKKHDLTIKRLVLEEEWSHTGPVELRHLTLEKFLDKSIYWPNYFDGYHSYDDFRTSFQDTFGHPPYTSPFMTRRWGLADDITQEQRDQGLAELDTYYSWVRDEILKVGTENNIIVLPLGRPGANYRDTVPAPGGEFSTSAFDPIDFCTVLGLPQLVIPIGQNPYQSRVTKQTEFAPIVSTIAGPRGSDADLLRIAVTALEHAGWPLEVLTGRVPFHVGDNERYVKDIKSKLA